MKKLSKFLVGAICSSFILAGCSNAPAQSTQPNQQTQETIIAESNNTEEVTAEQEEVSYPVTITTYNFAGEEVMTTYERAPEKVIPVYQGSIETMIALGLEDRVVSSYGLDNPIKEEWQEAFSKMNYQEATFAPTKEEVTMLQPDMILSWGSIFSDKKLGDVAYWIERNTNTYINTNTRAGGYARTLENEYTDILNLGKIFDVEDKAEAIVDEMKNEITSVLESVGNEEKPSVMVVEFFKDSISNYGEATLAGDMASKLGATLSLPGEKTTSKEGLVNCNPDVIFVVYMAYSGDDPETVKQQSLDNILKDESLASLDAVKNNRVYPLMLGDIYASGVRTLDGIKTIAEGLYPNK